MINFGLVIFTLGILTFIFWYFFYDTKYTLPKIDLNLTVGELGIDFTEEISTNSDVSKENLMKLVEDNPENMAYLNALRLNMNDDLDSYLEFLEQLGESERVYLQKALAYIDKLQNPQLGTGRLGQISNQSISELEQVLSINEYNWLAYYARGLNNLYWPVGLKRIDKAIQDLAYCVAVSEEYGNISNPLWADAYVAYGDALIKGEDLDTGFQVWKDGLKRFPNHPELSNRVKSGKEKAYSVVKSIRGIDSFQRPDENLTDLSILWTNKE